MQIQYINDYKYVNNKKKLTKKIILFFIILIILAVISGFCYIAYLGVKSLSKKSVVVKENKQLFIDKNYTKLIEDMNKQLLKKPFNSEYLTLRGYSYFFLAEDESDISKKKTFLTLSLIDLRRVLAITKVNKIDNSILFILGKIYYYLGEPYYYQSIDFLKKSYNRGNNRTDLLYLLGLIYSFTGEYNESIKVFQNALKIEESEILLLALANAYYKANDIKNAEIFLGNILKNSKDNRIVEKSYYILGEIYFQQNELEKALENFNKAIEINYSNAGAYFYRGEIYFKSNNLVKARAEWRKTLEIEPSHIKALKRIYN